MQKLTGRIIKETELAVLLETEITKIWIPKRAVVDIEYNDDDKCVTYYIQHWAELEKYRKQQ